MIKTLEKLIKKNFFLPLLLVLLTLPTVLGMIGPGFYSLHDDMSTAWLYEMDRAIRSGQIPPRWVPDLSYHFGYPLFNFIYPLPYYIGEIIYLTGISLVGSVKIIFGLSLILSGLTMFIFLRRHFGNLFSFVGAVVYVYTPYRAVDVYVRGAFGEAFAFVFLPLAAWGLAKWLKEGGRSNLVLAGFSLALLILSHNITFLMSLPLLFFYGLILVISAKEKIKKFLNLAAAFLLGAGLSAYFWLPALYEKKFMVADTVFNYRDHFPFLKQLIFPSWGYGISMWGSNDGMSFQIGVVNLLVIVLSIIGFLLLLFRKKLTKGIMPLYVWGFVSLLAVLFLMNTRSGFLWERITLLPYFQFPWRFLILATFLTSFLVGFLEHLPIPKRAKYSLGLVILVAAPLLTFPYFQPEKIFPQRTDDYFMNYYFALKTKDGYKKEISKDYLQNTEEYLRLPLVTEIRPNFVPPAKIEIEEGVISYEEKSVINFVGNYKSAIPTRIKFHQYDYPGWQVSINDKEVPIEPGKPHGDILINAPAGEYQFVIQFKETALRLFADLLSLSVLIFSLILYSKYFRSQLLK